MGGWGLKHLPSSFDVNLLDRCSPKGRRDTGRHLSFREGVIQRVKGKGKCRRASVLRRATYVMAKLRAQREEKKKKVGAKEGKGGKKLVAGKKRVAGAERMSLFKMTGKTFSQAKRFRRGRQQEADPGSEVGSIPLGIGRGRGMRVHTRKCHRTKKSQGHEESKKGDDRCSEARTTKVTGLGGRYAGKPRPLGCKGRVLGAASRHFTTDVCRKTQTAALGIPTRPSSEGGWDNINSG